MKLPGSSCEHICHNLERHPLRGAGLPPTGIPCSQVFCVSSNSSKPQQLRNKPCSDRQGSGHRPPQSPLGSVPPKVSVESHPICRWGNLGVRDETRNQLMYEALTSLQGETGLAT